MHAEIAGQPGRRYDYRMDAIATAHAGMVAIVNARGGRELFVVGADGNVVQYYPDPSSDTGFRAADTGLTGTAIAAGLDAQGRIVLFAAQGLQLAYVREQNQPDARWTAPAACAVPMPPQAVEIGAVTASSIGGELLVAALILAPTGDGVLNHLSWGAWPDGDSAPRMQRSPFTTLARHCIWTGSSLEDAAFTAIDHGIVDYRVATDRSRRRDIAPFTALDVASLPGTDDVVAVLQDGRVCRLAHAGLERCAWQPLDIGEPCRQVGLGRAASGAVHVFALGADSRLWHLAPCSAAPTGFLPPALLLSNVLRFGLAKGQGDLDLFVVGSARNAVRSTPAADDGDPPDSIRRIRWKTREAVELARMAWLAWFHPNRMLQPLGYIG